jgi:hypothetical protein
MIACRPERRSLANDRGTCLMTWRILVGVGCIATLPALFAVSNKAVAETDQPADACKPGVTDDRPMPLPDEMVARARQIFQLHIPDALIRKSTVYRCMDGRTLMCTTGANLACGKANTSRDPPGVATWCRDHADADDVPMFVTGHDTVYRWHCSGGKAVTEGIVETVDARGFLSRNWKDAVR